MIEGPIASSGKGKTKAVRIDEPEDVAGDEPEDVAGDEPEDVADDEDALMEKESVEEEPYSSDLNLKVWDSLFEPLKRSDDAPIAQQ